jgi:putative NADH-flavin reductase
MRVIIFGATGMLGHGALHECLRDPEVERVLSVVRAPSGRQHEKLREIVHKDFLDFRPIESKLTGFASVGRA